jgi:hypothetical protein
MIEKEDPHLELRKVILRYLDGSVLRAYAPLFKEGSDPVPAADISGIPLIVPLSQLKAVFFVRTFTGHPDYDGPATLDAMSSQGSGRLVLVRFSDGERVLGEVHEKTDTARGFYLTVLDPEDNNLLIYVNPTSLAEPPSSREEPAD